MHECAMGFFNYENNVDKCPYDAFRRLFKAIIHGGLIFLSTGL